MEKVFLKIEKLKDTYFDIWEDVCNIESPTTYKEGVDKVGEYFVSFAKKRGWKVEYSRQEKSGDVVCITMNPEVDAAPVSLSGHIDTVHPLGMFGTPAVKRDDENIYGPGVTDCKGGVVAALLAMDALEKSGFKKRPVMLLLQTDEENNCQTSNAETIKYICEKSINSVVFLNLESYTPGMATLSRKGILSYRFDIVGKESHSSRCVTEGANAIVDAAHKIIELDKFKDDDGITCSCGIVSGGTVVNTIAGNCSFSVNFRYKTNEQLEYIENFIKNLAATEHVKGCKCTYEKFEYRPSMEEKEVNVKMFEKINKIFADNNIPTLKGRMLRGGSDAAYVTQYGIPCVDSLGTEGGGSHSIKEFAKLRSLPESAKRIAAIVFNI